MVQCPRCGTQVEGSFCPSCGTQVVPPQQPVASMTPPPPPQGQPVPPAYPSAPPQPPYGAQGQPYGSPIPQPPQPPVYGQQPYGAPNQPYGAPGYNAPGYPPAYPQPKKSSVGKVLAIIIGVVVGLFALLVVIGSFLPDENALGVLQGPVISDRVDPDTQEPIGGPKLTLPPNTADIYAAIEVSLAQGSELSARWYYEGRHQQHLDTDLPVDKDYEGWASFNIGNDGAPWPQGIYKVEILVDGTKEAEVAFSVR